MVATAADVPPELFDRILDYLIQAVILARMPVNRTEERRTLSRCSLVCRYWSSRCRPRIFALITLRSREDLETLLSCSDTVRWYLMELTLEDTEPCIPWTHLVYAKLRIGKFPAAMNMSHKLDGACTPTSVQSLRSLHPSLPRRTPNLIRDRFPLFIHNYRLRTFTDIIHLIRKLWVTRYWVVDFKNVSWIAEQSDMVPPELRMKNRALCEHLSLYDCPERWPFVWLCITTRLTNQVSIELPPAFVHEEDAFRLGALIRVITARKDGGCCPVTHLNRIGPTQTRPATFTIYVVCGEQRKCGPAESKIAIANGRVDAIRLHLNTDPAHGSVPADVDWSAFGQIAAQCTALTAVTLRIEAPPSEVTAFAQEVAGCMAGMHEAWKLVVLRCADDSESWQTWVRPTPEVEEAVPETG